MIAQLLFQVIFDFLAFTSHFLEKGLLHALDFGELPFIVDHTSHHCHKLGELRDGLHFVQIEISV